MRFSGWSTIPYWINPLNANLPDWEPDGVEVHPSAIVNEHALLERVFESVPFLDFLRTTSRGIGR